MPDNPQLAIQRTVQSQVRDESTRTALVLWLASGTEVLPSWWSKRRDQELRKFWRSVDMLAGAVYALEAKMATIPFHIEPKDYTVRSYFDQASRFEYMLKNASEWGKGWPVFYGKWTQDLIGQDNGSFAEIIGDGDPAGPIVGMPYAVCSLDSARCDRTSNPEYPVVYLALDGKRYKLHYTRVAFASLQPSPIAEMHDVGFCSVSKCVNVSQNLLDILVYNQEKLGSRPSRGLMVASGGLDAEDIQAAFKLASENMDNQMLSRFSKTVVIGDATAMEGKIDFKDLASLPDGFDYETSTTIGMAAIALAFGVDARELWPMTSTGSTRADALIQHLKAQTKGIGHLLAIAEQAIFAKVLPATLTAEFDYTDDAQDRQQAEIKKIRSERHQVDLTTETVDARTVREQMLSDEDISRSQFEALELEDGRLDDGSPTLQVFYDPEYAAILNMGIPDPLDTEANNKKLILPIIADKRREIIMALGQLKNVRPRNQLMTALGALKALEDWYGEVKEPTPPQLLPFAGQVNPKAPEASTEPGKDETTVDVTNETVTEEDLETISTSEEAKALMTLQKTLGLMRPIYSVPAGAMPPAPIIIQSPSDDLLGRLAKALEGGNQTLTKALKERDKQLFKEQAEMLAYAVETILEKQGEQASAFAGVSSAVTDGLNAMVSAIRSMPAPVVNVTSQPVINVKPSEASITVKMPVVTEEETSAVERDYAGRAIRLRKTRTYRQR